VELKDIQKVLRHTVYSTLLPIVDFEKWLKSSRHLDKWFGILPEFVFSVIEGWIKVAE
jgi:predicted permease